MSALLRTAVFTVFVAGTMAVLVPYWILPKGARWHADAAGMIGLVLLLAGAAIYFWCAFWAFARAGDGTPAPLDPPKRLVVHGLYRVVRNPMYVGVGTILLAEAVGFHSVDLAVYLIIWALCVHLFVLSYEEPTLRRKFGASYEDYCRRVPRWLPKLNG
ncbi:MAG: isoprenylcysteine carboxylmethyltransferase family protein [Candidatus Acidiferrales bacterium]